MAISNGQVEEVMRLIASGRTAEVRSLNLHIRVLVHVRVHVPVQS